MCDVSIATTHTDQATSTPHLRYPGTHLQKPSTSGVLQSHFSPDRVDIELALRPAIPAALRHFHLRLVHLVKKEKAHVRLERGGAINHGIFSSVFVHEGIAQTTNKPYTFIHLFVYAPSVQRH